jgi:hypothetical protein
MKSNHLFVFVLLLFSFSSIFSQSKQKYQVACIGFYNLENFYDTIDDPKINDEEFLPTGPYRYNTAIYKDKISKLEEVVSIIGTDQSPDGLALMGVAEVENRHVIEDLIAQPKLKGRNYGIVHFNSPDVRGIDVGLVYNPKYFKPLHSEPLFVKLTNPDGSLYYTRDVLWVAGKFQGEIIHVFVNHWPSRRGGEDASAPSRAKAAGAAKKVIDSLMKIDPLSKIILMGDLNDDPVSPSVAVVLGAKENADDVKPGELFNPWVKFYKSGVGTLAYNDAWNLFDQIIVSKGWLNKKQSGFFFNRAYVFNRQFMVQKTGRYKGYPMRTWDGNRYNEGYSDHFPTYIEFLKTIK